MIAKFMTALFFLLIFCMIGCGEDPSSILKSETQPAVSPAVFEDVLISDDAPAAPLMCIVPREPVACVDGGWHEVTQVQRNQKILQTAEEEWNNFKKLKESGEPIAPYGSCKVWAYKVVVSASGGKVRLPLNHPDFKDRWLDSQFAEGRKASITTAKPGEIVQIEWKRKEGVGDSDNIHTLIVVSVGPDDITFIDSNWHKDEMLGKRTKSISFFEGDNASAKSFTIYTIK